MTTVPAPGADSTLAAPPAFAIRSEIDSPATPHDRTQVLRGRLIAITDLLALAEERPAIAVSQETYGL